jgi:tocopherol cyclase
MIRFIYETLHPDIYHGYRKTPPFFEGWYYKLVNTSEQHRYAIIPGVFFAEDNRKDHAFVQVLNGVTGDAAYIEYPISAFWAHEETFDVRVGDNHFRRDCLSLNINDPQGQVQGQLHFDSPAPWPVTLAAPGIMGWYAWMPFMECYHGVVSLDHTIRGTLTINGETVDFTNGHGYVEKDWGQNFPSGYIWQQTNHFSSPGISLTASIAMIPFVNRTFPGFIVGLWHHGRLYRMATYTGAVTEKLHIDSTHVYWTIRDRQHRLEMISERASGGLLKAPIRTDMHKRIDETMNATVHVRLQTHDGRTILDDTGRCAGMEVHGDLDGIITR